MPLSIKSTVNRLEQVLETLMELCNKTTAFSPTIPRQEPSKNKGFNNSTWVTQAFSISRMSSATLWLNLSVSVLQITTRQIIWIKTLWSKMDSRAVTWRATTVRKLQLKSSRLEPIYCKSSKQTKSCLPVLLITKSAKSSSGYSGNSVLHISWWAITNAKRQLSNSRSYQRSSSKLDGFKAN